MYNVRRIIKLTYQSTNRVQSTRDKNQKDCRICAQKRIAEFVLRKGKDKRFVNRTSTDPKM